MEEKQSAYYGQYYIPLQNLEQEILQWLRKLVDAYAEQAGETPVEHIRSRIKTAEFRKKECVKKLNFNDMRSNKQLKGKSNLLLVMDKYLDRKI